MIYCAILYQTSMVAKFLIYEAQLHAVAGGGAGLLYEVCKICTVQGIVGRFSCARGLLLNTLQTLLSHISHLKEHIDSHLIKFVLHSAKRAEINNNFGTLYTKLQRFLNLRYWSMGGGT